MTRKKFFIVADMMNLKIGFFFVELVLPKLNLNMCIHMNMEELGRIKKTKFS